MAENPIGKSKVNQKYEQWEVEQAVDTMIRAEEIKKNRVLFRLASALMVKKQKALDTLMKESK